MGCDFASGEDELTNPLEKYQYADAIDPATTKWQLSVWTDPNYALTRMTLAMAHPISTFPTMSPNAGLISGVDVGATLTFCEGNFDGDLDQDGTDASKFKQDSGRSKLLNPCPQANYYW